MASPRVRPADRRSPFRSAVLALMAVFPVLVPVACGAADDASPTPVVVDTLESGVVRVRNAAPPGGIDTLPLTLELGSRGGPVRWGRVAGVALAPGGHLVVLDEMAHRVRVFDGAGRLLAAFGREGEGPREFLTPMGVLRDGQGRIWVPDNRNARYSVFDSAGTLLETLPRRLRYQFRWRGAFLEDGRLLEGTSVPSTSRENFMVPGFVVGSPDGSGRDTIRIPWHEFPSFRPPERTRPGSATLTPSVPFTPRLEATPDPRGFVWEGHASVYRVARRDLAGDTVALVESGAEPLPVLDHEADSALEELRADFPSWRRDLRRSALPEHHPWFTDLRAGDDGTLWVRRPHRGEGTRFEVFDSTGVFCRAVFLPVTLEEEHTAVGWGRIAGVAEDALGVERVVIAPVGAPCGG